MAASHSEAQPLSPSSIKEEDEDADEAKSRRAEYGERSYWIKVLHTSYLFYLFMAAVCE